MVPSVDPSVIKGHESDFTADLNTLCAVLSSYGRSQESPAEVVPKLRLSECSSHGTSGSVFHVLLPDHSVQTGESAGFWQNATIYIEPERTCNRKRREDSVALGAGYHELHDVVGERPREQLFLSVSKKDRKIHQATHRELAGAKPWMLPASHLPGISLREALASGALLGSSPAHLKAKTVLFYLLAKGVWQLYGSDFFPTEWTKNTISFLPEHRERNNVLAAGVFLDRPLISVSIHHHPEQQRRSTMSDRSQTSLKIRELGIMLLEILVGREIESFRDELEFSAFLPGGQVAPYTDYRIANRLFEKRVKNHGDILKPVKNVIGRCLDDHWFRPLPTKKQSYRTDSACISKTMYERLVKPLESLHIHMYDDPFDLRPLHELEPGFAREHESDTLAQGPKFDPRGIVRLQGVVSETAHPETQLLSKTQRLLCEGWFDEVDKLQAILRAEVNPRNVKVAVIDTGFSPECAGYDIDPDNYKDFVEEEDTRRQDLTGHGTTMVRLIVHILDDADLYIARIFKDGKATEQTPERMEKAIKWAAEKDVDIIVMASGFSTPYDNIGRAINTLPDNILVIAAAGNPEVYDRVVFPARLQRVMCMFATTAINKSVATLNPRPRPRGYNFAILGETIQPDETWDAPVRGTSFAAAITAGFAASLLHFSRQPVPEGERELNLEGYEKMNAIFEELSRGYQDQGYDCIVPGRLLNLIEEGLDEQEQRRRIRDFLGNILLQSW